MSYPTTPVPQPTVWMNPNFRARDLPAIVFADRDGTLLKHVDYLGDPKQVALLPGVKEAVHRLLDAGCGFAILTNQSGVGRGYFEIEAVHACHARMFELMALQTRDLAGYCIAPGHPDAGDPYRKPAPKFVFELLEHCGITPDRAHIIGDTSVDLETAHNAGIHGWLAGNGKPAAVEAHRANRLPFDYRFRPDFPSCVEAILNEVA